MKENKPTLWDKTTKMLVGAAAVAVMFFGAKSMSGDKANDKQSDNTELVKSKPDETQDAKKIYNSRKFNKIKFLRESRKEVLEKYNSEKIKEGKEKSEKLQNKKDGTSQENTKETSENTNGKTVSLTNVKISSGEMEL